MDFEKMEATSGDEYFRKLAAAGVLEKVIKLTTQRRSLAQVNKLFYEQVCKIDGDEKIYKLHLDRACLQDESFFSSVLNSKRIFDEIQIDEAVHVNSVRGKLDWFHRHEFTFIIEMLKKNACRIRKLTFNKMLVTDDQLIIFLSCFRHSNIVELNITNSMILKEELGRLEDDDGLSFPHLRKLNFTNTRLAVYPITESPDDDIVAKTSKNMPKLFKLFEKSAYLIDQFCAPIWALKLIALNTVMLQELSIQKALPSNIRMHSVIESCPNLVSLDVMTCFIMEDVFPVIASLKNLRVLKINLDTVTMVGFAKLCKSTPNIQELGLKCNESAKWIFSTLGTIGISAERLYLDIRDIPILTTVLATTFQKGLTHLHIKTTNCFAAHVILSGCVAETLVSFTVEFYRGGSVFKNQFLVPMRMSTTLKELKMINYIPEFAASGDDIVYLLPPIIKLEKIYVEGFDNIKELHEAALMNHHNLKELTCIIKEPKIIYNFEGSVEFKDLLEEFGGKLKFMQITCASSTYHDLQKFPVERQKGNVYTFRHN